MGMRKLCCLGIALFLAATIATSTAHAGSGRWGSIVFQNPTSNTLSFQFRRADNSLWVDYSVPPNTHQVLYFELDHYGRTYTPNIRFDCVAGDGCVTNKYYELDFFEVTWSNLDDGFQYKFEYNDRGDFLDLYALD